MNQKLIAFDIDGTLLNSRNQILPTSIKAIQKLQADGHIVTIATGRSRFLVQDIIAQLKLSTYVLCNGAVAFHENERLINKGLDRKLMKDLQFFMEVSGMDLAVTGIDQMARVTDNHAETFEKVMNGLGKEDLDFQIDFIEKTDVYQGLGFYQSDRDGTFEENFPQLRFIRWLDDCVDIIDKDMSKAVTVLELAEKLGISQNNIIAFGDGMNDKEILAAAGIGVAMGNASEEVQAVADMVTASNDQDGIALALQKLELI